MGVLLSIHNQTNRSNTEPRERQRTTTATIPTTTTATTTATSIPLGVARQVALFHLEPRRTSIDLGSPLHHGWPVFELYHSCATHVGVLQTLHDSVRYVDASHPRRRPQHQRHLHRRRKDWKRQHNASGGRSNHIIGAGRTAKPGQRATLSFCTG